MHCFPTSGTLNSFFALSSVLIGYYIWKYKVSSEACLEKLKTIYPKAEPNLGFMIHLSQFEAKFIKKPEISDKMICDSKMILLDH